MQMKQNKMIRVVMSVVVMLIATVLAAQPGGGGGQGNGGPPPVGAPIDGEAFMFLTAVAGYAYRTLRLRKDIK